MVVPIVSNLGLQGSHWWRIFVELQPSKPAEQQLAVQAYGALLGCWLGAFPVLLNWGTRWQEWPLPSITGALLGLAVGRYGFRSMPRMHH
ncbi:hypothetical protein WJX73_003366 [Symbiochloris irregularis]|uniref:Uncharacterized protein n=1 Tax=Symbiochloris irregularis TaxID=706552 RepID=A0AAW1P6E3_9CHLO